MLSLKNISLSGQFINDIIYYKENKGNESRGYMYNNQDFKWSKFYNSNIKKEFLMHFPENSFKTYYYALSKASSFEHKLKKDLQSFTLDEISLVIKSFKLKTRNGITYIRVLKKYIDFYIKYVDNPKLNNPLENFSTKWALQFIEERKYMANYQIDDLIDQCVNPQDKLLIYLLFYEGVGGTALSELRNLSKADIDLNRQKLMLKDDEKGKREIELTSKCYSLLISAIEQKKQLIENGKAIKYKAKILVETDFIFRDTVGGRKKDDLNDIRVANQFIYNRLSDIRRFFKLPKYFNNSFIQDCGKIYFAKIHYEELGFIDEDSALDCIYKKYNKSKISQTANGKIYYRYNDSDRDLVQNDIIEQLYNISLAKIQDFQLVSKQDKESFTSEITKREKQDQFRDKIKTIYKEKCAITGESTDEVLQAAHIQPYINQKSHHPQNGIYLRADIHHLFDKLLISIDKNYNILVSNSIDSTYYQQYSGKQICLPENIRYYPSEIALAKHREKFFEKEKLLLNSL